MASKFVCNCFTDSMDGHAMFAVSKEKCNFQEAVDLAKKVFGAEEFAPIAGTGWVRYGFYMDDGDRYNGWVLEMEKPKRGCPVWVFERKDDKYDGRIN